MFQLIYGTSKLVGFIMLMYGSLLLIVPEFMSLNVIGVVSYYVGAYQFCVAPVDFEDEELIT